MRVCLNDGRWSCGLSSCPSAAQVWHGWIGSVRRTPINSAGQKPSFHGRGQHLNKKTSSRLRPACQDARLRRVRGIQRLTLMPLPVRPRRARPQTGGQIHIHKSQKSNRWIKRAVHIPTLLVAHIWIHKELKHICNLSRLTGKLGRNKCMNEEITLWLAALHWEWPGNVTRSGGIGLQALRDRESSESKLITCVHQSSADHFLFIGPPSWGRGMRDGWEAGIHLRQGIVACQSKAHCLLPVSLQYAAIFRGQHITCTNYHNWLTQDGQCEFGNSSHICGIQIYFPSMINISNFSGRRSICCVFHSKGCVMAPI